MLYVLSGCLAVLAFLVLAVFPVLRKDMRRWERRQGRLFAPIERRKRTRRMTGLFADLRWALRYRMNQWRRPRKPVRPVSGHR